MKKKIGEGKKRKTHTEGGKKEWAHNLSFIRRSKWDTLKLIFKYNKLFDET